MTSRLGSYVTLLEAGDCILAKGEPEASHVVAEALAFDGVRIRTGSKVVKAEATDGNAGRLAVPGGDVTQTHRECPLLRGGSVAVAHTGGSP